MTNKLIVPNAESLIEQMKLEIANEFGIELGADTSSRLNGKVGAEMTKRLVELGKQHLASIENVNYSKTNLNQGNPPIDHLH